MKKLIKPIVYILSVGIVLWGLISFWQNLVSFSTDIESRSFDLRQKITHHYKEATDNIIILAIDDKSYENFKDWPVPREYWADLISELEKYNPKLIAFDLLFIKKINEKSDAKLINAITNNKNVLVAMDFDNIERPLPDFPDDIKAKITGAEALKNKADLEYKNSRGLIKELLDGTSNIGFINVQRDPDGTIREYMPFIVYKNEFYRHLALVGALRYLERDTRNFVMKNNEVVLDAKHKIPLNKDGKVILNWYKLNKNRQTFEHISLCDLEKEIKNGNKEFLNKTLNGKIVYVGPTATALSDIKATPVEPYLAGVETHAIFINNVLDNNFIKRTNTVVDLVVTLLLAGLVYLIVFRNNSILLSNIEFVLTLAGYFILTIVLMHFFNIWIALATPLGVTIGVYMASYIYKYLLKSKDYEQTYKLAVTDALTEMYNHRYFQEQMIANCENSARYETAFSLILIDIDFFKKFNDTFGHQSGDAVLKQVAQVIKKSIRATDIACRYGGEEMAVILTNTGKDEAILTAEKICLAIRNNEFSLVNGQKTNVTISLGVSTAPINGKTPVELIEYADKCLYQAKEKGRNQVVSNI